MFATSAICMVVASIAPATPRAGGLANENRQQYANARTWTTTAIPQATLKISGRGAPVSALSGNGRVAVIGDTRAVDLFHVSSASSWGSFPKPAERLRVPHLALMNLAAVATSWDGTTVLVAVGAMGNNPAAVYVFHVSSPRAWRSSVKPTAELRNAVDPSGFGSGVALSADGTTALVGALGGADVFHVATTGSWRDSSKPTATLVADAEGAAMGGLSIAVALSADGTTALIGATSLDTFVGAAYVFHVSGVDAWASRTIPRAVLTDGAVGLFGDGFGGAVALSPDGMTALVGAPSLAFGSSGAAYIFQVRSPDAWTSTTEPDAAVEPASIPNSGGHSNRRGDVLGWSVALSERGTALVGEPSVLSRPGAANLAQVAGLDESWRSSAISYAKLTNAASTPGDLLGASVGLSSDGRTALVSSARAAFIYTQTGSRDATNCYVPYVVGKALRAARRAINSTHCRVGTVRRVDSSRVRPGRVISQRPKPGDRLSSGAKDALTISNG